MRMPAGRQAGRQAQPHSYTDRELTACMSTHSPTHPPTDRPTDRPTSARRADPPSLPRCERRRPSQLPRAQASSTGPHASRHHHHHHHPRHRRPYSSFSSSSSLSSSCHSDVPPCGRTGGNRLALMTECSGMSCLAGLRPGLANGRCTAAAVLARLHPLFCWWRWRWRWRCCAGIARATQTTAACLGTLPARTPSSAARHPRRYGSQGRGGVATAAP